MKKLNLILFCSLLALPFFSLNAAETTAVQFSQVNPAFTISFSNNAGGFNLGFRFTTIQPLQVTQLGIFDDNGDGLLQSHEVGLYKVDGTLLTSTTVTNSDPLEGLFRFNPIAPLILPAGDYVLSAAVGYNPGNPVDKYTHDPFDLAFAPQITFIENREKANTLNNLVYPDFVEHSVDPPLTYGWFGPNMKFASVAIPEPGTLLILGSALSMVGARRWWKKSTVT